MQVFSLMVILEKSKVNSFFLIGNEIEEDRIKTIGENLRLNSITAL